MKELRSDGLVKIGTNKKTKRNPKGGGGAIKHEKEIREAVAQGLPITPNSKVMGAIHLKDAIGDGEVRPAPTNGMYSGSASPQDYLDQMTHTMNSPYKGTPWKYPSKEALEKEIRAYFEFMVSRRIPLTVAGLSAWLGVSIRTVNYWQRNRDSCPFYELIESASAFIHALTEQGAVDGNVNAHIYTILSTNYWGLNNTANVNLNATSHINEVDDEDILNKLPK